MYKVIGKIWVGPPFFIGKVRLASTIMQGLTKLWWHHPLNHVIGKIRI